jgi:hypothetical protein
VFWATVQQGWTLQNAAMIEVFLIALLVWLWVIERRLNGLNDTVRSLKLDVDGMRARAAARSKAAPDELPLPEVTSLGRSNPEPAARKTAVH